MSNIFRSSDAHQISWLINRKFRRCKFYNFTNKLLTFSDTYSTDSDSIPSILTEEIHRFLSQIQVRSSLYNRKQDSTNSIIFGFQMFKGSLSSTMGHLHMLFYNFFTSTRRRTNIKYH